MRLCVKVPSTTVDPIDISHRALRGKSIFGYVYTAIEKNEFADFAINRISEILLNWLGFDNSDDFSMPVQGKYFVFHPTRKLIAVSTSARTVAIFDIGTLSWVEKTIKHNLMSQGGIFSLDWCSFDSNSLAIGTQAGICVWDSKSWCSEDTSQAWMRFLQHEKLLDCNVVVCSPHGRFIASLSRGERVIYIWDYLQGASSSLFCLEGTQADTLSWSPSGLFLCATNR